ncbi:hemagglutinin repeat-containing protein, partial [Marinomonas transparens]
TANTWAGSNISAGDLTIKADKNVAILASDISVQNDVDIQGENILVGGREAIIDTTQDSITKTKTVTAGVRNAYVDAYLAVKVLDDAKDAVKEAESAYNDAKQQVAEGKMPKGDLDFYEIKLNAMKKSEKSAEMAVVSAAATAAMSSATYGFTATAGATTQETTNSRSATQGSWNGSNIQVGNNASFNGDNNLTVEGSAIAALGTLEANAKNIDIKAGKNTYTETTSSRSKGASASVTASLGGGVSGSVGINTSKSNSNSDSTQYTNSSLSAGTLTSDSEHLTLEGGNLYGDKVAINTQTLDVISLQDTAKSESKSQGGGINFGMGQSAKDGVTTDSSSISVNYNQTETSSDYASVTQQSSIASGDQGYQINVTGNTNLVGGLITSTDAAEADGNNSFSTGTLTQSELENHAQYSASSAGIDMSLSTSQKTNNNTGEVGESEGGFGKSMGRGSDGDSRQSTTQSGINTANIAITDADAQQQLTGQTVEDAIADIKTATSTDSAQEDSNGLQNNFDQAEVEALVNSERVATQALDQTVTDIGVLILGELEELEEKKGQMDPKEYESQRKTLKTYGLLVSSIGAGLLAPTDSVAGSWAAAASPVVANQIGQYFKGLAADNDNGQLSGGQEAAHNLAHGILAAAVASAGGNDALTAGVAAAGSEAAAPALAEWLYGSSNPDDLKADEKQTLTAILGAASTAVGATTGNSADAVNAGLAGENAVENNYLSYNEKSTQIQLKRQLQHCIGVCTLEKIQEIKDKLAVIAYVDKKREFDYAQACAGSANEDCNNEMGKVGLAYRSYGEPAKKDGGFLKDKELAAEQNHTRNLMFNVSSNIDTEFLERALDNADVMAGAFSLGALKQGLNGLKALNKAGTAQDVDISLNNHSGGSTGSSGSMGAGYVDAETGHSNLNDILGIQQKRAFDEFGFFVDDLLKSGSTPLNNAGVTKAGHALDKHARNQRKGSSESVFPELKGNNQQRAQQAQNFLDDILNNPNSTVIKLGRGGIKVEHPNGMQALFNKDGSFSGFQER